MRSRVTSRKFTVFLFASIVNLRLWSLNVWQMYFLIFSISLGVLLSAARPSSLYRTNYQITTNPPRSNITKQEIQSLHQLKTDDSLVKPADKGGAIVIWPKDSYLKEAYRQLNDSNHYQKIQKDPTPDILEDTKKLAYNLQKSKIIDNMSHKFLTTDTTARTPHLYLLPKIHKQNVPGRPIISGCGGPTAKLSQFADRFLKPLLNHIPAYIQDTAHFLRRIFSLNQNLPENIILITIDVKPLMPLHQHTE